MNRINIGLNSDTILKKLFTNVPKTLFGHSATDEIYRRLSIHLFISPLYLRQ